MTVLAPPIELVPSPKQSGVPNRRRKESAVPDLTNQEVQALGKAVGLDVQEPELTEVAHSLNAILELMDAIDLPEANAVEPLPLILPDPEL